MEKGLLWLKGDTARWGAHYAFFARSFGEVQLDGVDEDRVHLFTPSDPVAGDSQKVARVQFHL